MISLSISSVNRPAIIIDDPKAVAREMKKEMPQVKENRLNTGDAYSFDWSIKVNSELQRPFTPTHDNMAKLNLFYGPKQPEKLAANLRQAFSGIVAGNVKEVGMKEIEKHGPYKLHGDAKIMAHMDTLLRGFVIQYRMKLPSKAAYTLL